MRSGTREVSFLELFYDLVYVVLIGRTTHHLAVHVDGRGVAEFAVVFGLIWLAWFNGTLWHELHGREDGRSRNYIFLQMGLLALLAVFAGEATGDDGREFAITYSVLFALLTWQWYQVQRSRHRSAVPTDMTTRYLAGDGDHARSSWWRARSPSQTGASWLWAVVVVGWVVGGFALDRRPITPRDSARASPRHSSSGWGCSRSSCSARWSSVSSAASATPSNATPPRSSPA